MTGLRLAIAIGVLSLATGCCSTDQRWGQMEGFQDISFVNNGQPLSLPSKAPRDDIYGLWQLTRKRCVGNCIYRDGFDDLMLTVFLHKGETLGFRKSKCGMEAYAGNLCIPLSCPDYSWRIAITDEDRKQNAQDEFGYAVSNVGYGILQVLAYIISGLGRI
jgi:hypothetical protein